MLALGNGGNSRSRRDSSGSSGRRMPERTRSFKSKVVSATRLHAGRHHDLSDSSGYDSDESLPSPQKKPTRSTSRAKLQSVAKASLYVAAKQPPWVVRSVTFSFLWDFSRFHGTNREIRD
eukprot:SAG31_NODE_1355_length_8661_cov_3.130343_7_plen_120_part_00